MNSPLPWLDLDMTIFYDTLVIVGLTVGVASFMVMVRLLVYVITGQ
jgi:hypothetical protein